MKQGMGWTKKWKKLFSKELKLTDDRGRYDTNGNGQFDSVHVSKLIAQTKYSQKRNWDFMELLNLRLLIAMRL